MKQLRTPWWHSTVAEQIPCSVQGNSSSVDRLNVGRWKIPCTTGRQSLDSEFLRTLPGLTVNPVFHVSHITWSKEPINFVRALNFYVASRFGRRETPSAAKGVAAGMVTDGGQMIVPNLARKDSGTRLRYPVSLCLILLVFFPDAFAGRQERSEMIEVSPPARASSRDAQLFATSAPLRVYSHPSPTLSVAFSPDGKVIVAGDSKGRIWLWPIGSEEMVNTIEAHRKGVRTLAFSPDGSVIASGGGDGLVRVWDSKTYQPLAWLEDRHRDSVSKVVFSPDANQVLSASFDASIVLRDRVTGRKLMTYFGHSAAVTGAAFAVDAPCVISGAEDRSLQGWNRETGEQIDFSLQTGKVLAVALTKRGHLLAAATSDGGISVRRTDGCTVHTVALRLEYHRGAVSALMFSPSGRYLYSAGDDRTIIKWNLETGKPEEALVGHQGAILALAVSSDGTMLASSSRDRTVRIWRQNDEASEIPLALPMALPSSPATP